MVKEKNNDDWDEVADDDGWMEGSKHLVPRVSEASEGENSLGRK